MEGIREVQGKRERTRPARGAARRSIRPHVHAHPLEVQRKAVQLYLEEGFSPELIARKMGVGKRTLSKWVRLYRTQGKSGLQAKPRGPSRRRPKVVPAVKTQVVELKRRHPDFGIQKISQFLRRSAETLNSQEITSANARKDYRLRAGKSLKSHR